MIGTIFQASLLYWATALDLLLILALLFSKYPESRHSLISWGQIIGSALLIIVSLALAFIFHFVPEDWVLGFLGMIPVFFGLKILIFGDNDEEEVEGILAKRQDKNLVLTVILLAFTSCGADNIGLFTPYLATLKTGLVPLVILTFGGNILLLGFLGHKLSHISPLHRFLERYSRWMMGIVYLTLGVMILIEAGTIERMVSLF